ncbi:MULTISPECIES: ImmA/IrrE family metallo-endopeptidase [Rhizobium]|uniref:ImmA/IrrE family metallo-endopeptidase n=1 Tax=Rhizobium TaxID=379 RepID=UPI001C90D606|nr:MULTISPECIES: ImmA/IrrE family metallo-endopeptidase [Rhizobium]MBY2987009.1 ImmA/IrrE family metallo-endopeptidase [Rhizobium leguminosarum]MBY3049141.1 ImmA/IrrE family metallo-endopeptidase [Rhizobium laguerreae]WSH22693.1 ImmA/IrrE family metallo-endopeptidase [Rhizobium ruizarguesonis]WSH35633.1 ImmA/IrrE family metallo-endopeptidase [Rhizobium ruizarguesonis]
MAKDHYTSRGLTTLEMMTEALRFRNDFEIAHVERVDIVSILEFKLVQRFPNFRLVIKQDTEMNTHALADPQNDRIVVQRSVYRAACDNDAEARLILAHELGHYLLHREKNVTMHMDPNGAVQPIKKMNSTESTEDQADMFARHFLAPPHLAYRYRQDPSALAAATSVPLRISRGNITMSKRPEVYSIRSLFNEKAPSSYPQI